MFAVVGVAGLLLLVGAAVLIFYLAGNRGAKAQVENREDAARGHQQSVPHEPKRTQGQGDL